MVAGVLSRVDELVCAAEFASFGSGIAALLELVVELELGADVVGAVLELGGGVLFVGLTVVVVDPLVASDALVDDVAASCFGTCSVSSLSELSLSSETSPLSTALLDSSASTLTILEVGLLVPAREHGTKLPNEMSIIPLPISAMAANASLDRSRSLQVSGVAHSSTKRTTTDPFGPLTLIHCPHLDLFERNRGVFIATTIVVPCELASGQAPSSENSCQVA